MILLGWNNFGKRICIESGLIHKYTYTHIVLVGSVCVQEDESNGGIPKWGVLGVYGHEFKKREDEGGMVQCDMRNVLSPHGGTLGSVKYDNSLASTKSTSR